MYLSINKFLSETIEEKEQFFLYALLGFILLIGLCYSYYLSDIIRFSDELDYIKISRNLSSHQLYSIDGTRPTAFRAPGYPLIISLFTFFNLPISFIRFLNFIFLALTSFVLFKLIKKYHNTSSAFIALILIYFYPILFFAAGTFYPQIIGSFLMVLVIYLILKGSIISFFLGGATYGYLILTVPAFLLNLPVFVIAVWVFCKRLKLFCSLIFLGTALLIISPWVIRNYFIFHKPFLTSHTGLTFLYGNCEDARPTSYSDVDPLKYIPYYNELSEVEKNQECLKAGLKWINENKLKALKLYLGKLVNYFNYKVQLRTRSQESNIYNAAMALSYIPLLILFFIRLFFYFNNKPSTFEKLLISLYLSNAFLLSIFLIRIRLRLPFDFLLIGIVAIFIDNVLKKIIKENF